MKKLIFLSVIFFSISSYAITQDTQQSLKKINKTIEKVQKALNKNHIKKSKLEQILKDAEVSMGKVDQNLVVINHQIRTENQKMAQLENQKQRLQTRLQNQQADLAQEIKTLYYLGNHSYLKTLLTQSGDTQFSQNMTYFRYLNQSRLQSMQQMQQTLKAIQQNQTKLKVQAAQLQKVLNAKEIQQQKLLALQSSRNKILVALKAKIDDQQQTLNNLQQNKKRLQQLVEKLREEKQTPVQPPLPFNKMQHQLNWPVKGKIEQHYGESVENSQLTASGVVIAAKQGTYIHAIYPGKVIFSDWLKGFGLLIIIDHGNGYMSLYGRNNALYHQVGDFVNKGEVIASVGKSGGYQQSGLYFEIRKNGDPLNPEAWCR